MVGFWWWVFFVVWFGFFCRGSSLCGYFSEGISESSTDISLRINHTQIFQMRAKISGSLQKWKLPPVKKR